MTEETKDQNLSPSESDSEILTNFSPGEIIELEIEESDDLNDSNISSISRGASDKLKPGEKPFNIEKEQEKTRGNLAYILVGTLSASLVVFFIFIFTSDLEKESKKELITLIWTSQVTLIGTSLGFYFGKK